MVGGWTIQLNIGMHWNVYVLSGVDVDAVQAL